jgi:electron transfer flavoprotein alpha subunit
MPVRKVAIIAEVEQGKTHSAVMDLAALAARLAENESVEIRWLVVGSNAADAGAVLSGRTGYPAVALEIPGAVSFTGEFLFEVLHPFLMDMRPDVIALLHTSRSQDYAAALAIGLDAACVSGVQGLVMQDGGPVFQRAIFGGKWMAAIQADDRPVVLTVLPGYFKFEGDVCHSVVIETQRPSLPATRACLIAIKESATEAALTQAATVVAAGRGIGSEDNLDLISRLADLFPKSAVAGSRIVCDAGWLPYHRQVGVTGATVSPELYLACGISGAFQHLAGMSGSRFVVAINSDPHAAIFNAADVGVVADLNAFLPLLIEALEEKGSGTGEKGL